jgi:hypothetical protein
MKIEKVKVVRACICRFTEERWSGGHDILPGDFAIKIHDFSGNGNLVTLFLCMEHAQEFLVSFNKVLI